MFNFVDRSWELLPNLAMLEEGEKHHHHLWAEFAEWVGELACDVQLPKR